MSMLNEPGEIHLLKTVESEADAVRARRSPPIVVVAFVMVVVLAGAAAFLYLRRGRTEPAAGARTPAADSVKVREDTQAVNLPPRERRALRDRIRSAGARLEAAEQGFERLRLDRLSEG